MARNMMIRAFLDDYNLIRVEIDNVYYNGKSESFNLKNETGNLTSLNLLKSYEVDNAVVYELQTDELDFHKQYEVIVDYGYSSVLQYREIVNTTRYDDEFYYDGKLGNIYSKKGTEFKLWAPTAHKAILEITIDSYSSSYHMVRQDKGVYCANILGDLDGAIYTYLVYVNGNWEEIVDPYALTTTSNKKKAVVIDTDKAKINSNSDKLTMTSGYQNAIIYETHIRDFSKQLDTINSGKYLGVVEKGLKTKSGNEAGIDYLRKLGITHLQIQPFMDFASVDEDNVDSYYNWGYDVVHFFTPEGSFSSDASNPYARVIEAKEMISKLHNENIKVIMDVVFNHMYDHQRTDFEKLVPYYYFRSSNGVLSNGSFCGNDFATNKRMVRKLLLDVIEYWMKEYGVDGFRFDLMGIIDITTMLEIEKVARSINPDVILVGEGWNMPTQLPEEEKSTIENQHRLPTVGHFNNFFRDHTKGKTSDTESSIAGYCTGDLSYIYAVSACMSGCVLSRHDYVKLFNEPTQSVNYVECHDNATAWDKMCACVDEDEAIKIKRQKMMLACVLLAQGIPFIHSGQEFCRTKNGLHNTYASSDEINQVDWERKDQYLEVTEYLVELIKLRKKLKCLRLDTAREINGHAHFEINNGVLIYTLTNIGEYDGYGEVKIIINATKEMMVIDTTGYQVLLGDTSEGTTDGLSVKVLAK